MYCYMVEGQAVALVAVGLWHQLQLLHLAVAVVAVVEELSYGFLLLPLVLLKQ
jgi:hypothetical protein